MTIPPPPPPPGGPWGPPGGYGQYPGQPNGPGGYGQYPGQPNVPGGGAQWGYGEPWATPPPPKRPTGWIVAGIAAIVALALIAGFVVWKAIQPEKDSATTASSSTASAAASSAPESTATASSTAAPSSSASSPRPAPPAGSPQGCKGKAATAGPRTPAGWSTVLSPRDIAYDVPAEWIVNECTTLMGWEKPCPDGPFGFCPIRTMSGTAELPYIGCPKKVVAMTGVPGANNTEDINRAVRDEAALVADIYTSDSGVVPTVSLSPATPLDIGGKPAVKIVADVTGMEVDGCGSAPSAKHIMVATKVPGQPGCVLFVLAMDQGVPGAADAALADQILGTLRIAG